MKRSHGFLGEMEEHHYGRSEMTSKAVGVVFKRGILSSLRRAALIAVVAGAGASLALMLRAGHRQNSRLGDNRSLRCGTLLRGWQINSEHGSDPGFRFPQKYGNDGICGRQTEAAAGFGSEVWVEDTREDIGGYSGARTSPPAAHSSTAGVFRRARRAAPPDPAKLCQARSHIPRVRHRNEGQVTVRRNNVDERR